MTTTPAQSHDKATGTRPSNSNNPPRPRRRRTIGRWLMSFLGFPIGGYSAFLALGPMDSAPTAFAGGAIAGAVLGASQAWAFGASRPRPIVWVLSTAAGLAVGAAIGANVTAYATDVASLLAFGSVTGVSVGIAQGIVLSRRLGAAALLWPILLTGSWALGWLVSEAVMGSSVDEHFYIFGSSGALVVAALTSPLVLVVNHHASNAHTSTATRPARIAS